MEKQTRDFKVKFDIDWTYGIEIKKIREDLDAIEALGATHVHIEPDISYDCPTLEIYAFARRMETDEDVRKRLAIVNELVEETRKKELEQLARLKAKYEK